MASDAPAEGGRVGLNGTNTTISTNGTIWTIGTNTTDRTDGTTQREHMHRVR
jgi:hypothetical protein